MENQGKQQKPDHEPAEFQVIDKRQFVNLDLDAMDASTVPEEKPRYLTYVEELLARMAETERRFQEKKKQIDEEIVRQDPPGSGFRPQTPTGSAEYYPAVS
jgi:hypothetical protein